MAARKPKSDSVFLGALKRLDEPAFLYIVKMMMKADSRLQGYVSREDTDLIEARQFGPPATELGDPLRLVRIKREAKAAYLEKQAQDKLVAVRRAGARNRRRTRQGPL